MRRQIESLNAQRHKLGVQKSVLRAHIKELVEKTTLPKEKLAMSGENVTILRDGVIALKEKVGTAGEKVGIPAEEMDIRREKVGVAAEKSDIYEERAIKSVSATLRRVGNKRLAVKENDSAPNRKVNVLLLMAGQQRFDELGGEKTGGLCHTPHIEQRLGAEGIVFTNAFATSPDSVPSRTALLTGATSDTNGLRSSYDLDHGAKILVPTLFDMLRQQGYYTAHFGKWHSDKNILLRFSEQPALQTAGVERHYRKWLLKNFGVRETNSSKYFHLPSGPFAGSGATRLPPEQRIGVYLVERALQLIERVADRERFAVAVSFLDPSPNNNALVAQEKYLQDYAHLDADGAIRAFESLPLPASSQGELVNPPHRNTTHLSPSLLRLMTAIHCALLSEVDAQVGALLDGLKRLGHGNDTLVIYTAPHGHPLGHHGQFVTGHSVLFDEVVRVPLVLRLPGGRRQPHVITSTVSLLDLANTIADLSGTEPLENMRGRSLRHLWEQDASEAKDGGFAVSRLLHHSGHNQIMARTSSWKWLCVQDKRFALYDLKSDPNEMLNVVRGACKVKQKHVSVLKGIMKKLADWHRRGNSTFFESPLSLLQSCVPHCAARLALRWP